MTQRYRHCTARPIKVNKNATIGSFLITCSSKNLAQNLVIKNIVIYSRVLFMMELYCKSKIQHTRVNYNQHLSEHMYTSNPYGLRTLTPMEFVQQDPFSSSSNTNWPSCSQKVSKDRCGSSLYAVQAQTYSHSCN
jgi:hypothetical protein